jgi:hypothetical protein
VLLTVQNLTTLGKSFLAFLHKKNNSKLLFYDARNIIHARILNHTSNTFGNLVTYNSTKHHAHNLTF